MKNNSSQVSFQQLLISELKKRKAIDSKYSIRKFAKSLGINDSSLSQILRHKRKLSSYVVQTVGRNLGLSSETIASYLQDESISEFDYLDMNKNPYFSDLTDWRYDAAIELIHGMGDPLDIEMLSQKLKISISECRRIVDALIDGKLIVKKKNTWSSAVDGVSQIVSPAETSENAKKYQINLLQQSTKAVENIDVRQRNHTSVVFCMDEKEMELATELIKRFRRRFMKQLQNTKSRRKKVYSLQVGFFPLSN